MMKRNKRIKEINLFNTDMIGLNNLEMESIKGGIPTYSVVSESTVINYISSPLIEMPDPIIPSSIVTHKENT